MDSKEQAPIGGATSGFPEKGSLRCVATLEPESGPSLSRVDPGSGSAGGR